MVKKIKAVLSLLLLFGISSATHAQSIFTEDFSDNSKNWAVGKTSDYLLEVRYGEYIFEHYRESGSWHVWKNIEFDERKDFEIVTAFRKVSGVQNNGYGLTWGMMDTNNYFSFEISGDGHFRVAKKTAGDWQNIQNWTKSDLINTGNGSRNTLKISRKSGYYYFYINDVYVYQNSEDFNYFFGDRIGYNLNDNQQVAINYLKIDYISSPSPYQSSSLSNSQVIFSEEFSNNDNNWTEEKTSEYQLEMHYGEYIFEHSRESGGWHVWKTIKFDERKDFEIVTEIRKVSGIQNNGYGITWGMQDTDNYFSFQISGNGYYRITKESGGDREVIQKWTKSDLINTGDNVRNTLKITSKKGISYFYINNVYIYQNSTEFKYFLGDRIGYKINENQRIAINYLRVNYLSNPSESNLLSNNQSDTQPPEITIVSPNISRGLKPVEKNNQITVIGKAKDASGIFAILINGEEANIDGYGNFSKDILLAYGNNQITVTATDIRQNTSTKTFVVERETTSQNLSLYANQNSNSFNTGEYYALIIGNDDYKDPAIASLDQPIKDATALFNVLTRKYTFDPQNVTFLKNASYVQMIEAFDQLSNKITEHDNLLVFYAGHGWWDELRELGYWLPTDARQSSTAFWIANSRISDYMSSINSKHTLLIADACFSGSIFKTRAAFADAGQAINSLYSLPSRSAMTSGNLKEVPDKSVFLEYLVKRLDNNTERYLSADQLFISFRIAVMNNSYTEPQFGTIQNAGDEGGEFIFVRR